MNITDAAELIELQLRAELKGQSISVLDIGNMLCGDLDNGQQVAVDPAEDPTPGFRKEITETKADSYISPMPWVSLKGEQRVHVVCYGNFPRFPKEEFEKEGTAKLFLEWMGDENGIYTMVMDFKRYDEITGNTIARMFGEAQAKDANCLLGIPRTLEEQNEWREFIAMRQAL